MLKKIVAVLVVATLTATLFTACQRGTTSSSSDSLSGSSSQPDLQSSSVPSSSQSSSPVSSFPAPESDPLYVKTYQYYEAKKYDAAVSVCDQALAADPNCFWAYNMKGTSIYFANGNSVADSCLALIDKSTAINPNYFYAYFNKALILKGLKRYDESITCFQKVLELKPGDTWSYYGIATCYADTRQTDPALQYLGLAIGTDASVKKDAKTEYHFDYLHGNAQFEALVGS